MGGCRINGSVTLLCQLLREVSVVEGDDILLACKLGKAEKLCTLLLEIGRIVGLILKRGHLQLGLDKLGLLFGLGLLRHIGVVDCENAVVLGRADITVEFLTLLLYGGLLAGLIRQESFSLGALDCDSLDGILNARLQIGVVAEDGNLLAVTLGKLQEGKIFESSLFLLRFAFLRLLKDGFYRDGCILNGNAKVGLDRLLLFRE